MYKNAGKKIKVVSILLFIIGVLVSIYVGVMLHILSDGIISTDSDEIITGAVIIVAGAVASWLVSLIIYGFGLIVESAEKTDEIKDILIDIREKKPDYRTAEEKANTSSASILSSSFNNEVFDDREFSASSPKAPSYVQPTKPSGSADPRFVAPTYAGQGKSRPTVPLFRDNDMNEAVSNSAPAVKPEETKSVKEPEFEKPKYEEPKYEEPKYEEPKYEEPKYEEPKYEEPKYEEPKYEEPKYEEPKYEEPKYEEPKYEEPKYEEPKYEEPKYEEPAASAAEMPKVPSMNNVQVHTYAAAAVTEPVPAVTEPAAAQPVYEETPSQVYTEPAAAYAEPATGYAEPAQPVYEEAAAEQTYAAPVQEAAPSPVDEARFRQIQDLIYKFVARRNGKVNINDILRTVPRNIEPSEFSAAVKQLEMEGRLDKDEKGEYYAL